MIKASRTREQRSKGHADDQMIQSLNDAEQMEADKRREIYIMDRDKKQKLVRAAAKERAKAPRVPITQQMLNAARTGVNNLRNSRVLAYASSLVYPTLALEHDEAQDDLERLEKAFTKQEHKKPGTQYLTPLPYPSNDPADNQAFPFANPKPKGGKSKRVKSKRVKSKRRTQRRNTRK
jgi:hypothetical protein